MDGYLLDTNVVKYLYSEKGTEHPAVLRRYESLSADAPVFISVITLGEIEYGHRRVSERDSGVQERFNAFLRGHFPDILPLPPSTHRWYGRLRAKLDHEFSPQVGRRLKWPEDAVDPVTAKQLGIQENDLWLAAQALDRSLVFVTNDRLTHIRRIAPPEFRVENWAAP